MFQFLLEMITGPVRKLFIPINYLMFSIFEIYGKGAHYEVIMGN